MTDENVKAALEWIKCRIQDAKDEGIEHVDVYETIEAALTRPKVDVEEIKAKLSEDFKKWCDESDASGIYKNRMGTVHLAIGFAIDHFQSQGYLQAQGVDVEILNFITYCATVSYTTGAGAIVDDRLAMVDVRDKATALLKIIPKPPQPDQSEVIRDLAESIVLLLPLARGYAAHNPDVKVNQRIINLAKNHLTKHAEAIKSGGHNE